AAPLHRGRHECRDQGVSARRAYVKEGNGMSLRTSRRRVLGLIGVVAGASLLAACAASPPPTQTPPAAKPAEAPKPTTAPAAPAAAATAEPAKPAAAAPATGGAIKESVHWYTWSASDGEVWKQSLDDYNAKYKEKGF